MEFDPAMVQVSQSVIGDLRHGKRFVTGRRQSAWMGRM